MNKEQTNRQTDGQHYRVKPPFLRRGLTSRRGWSSMNRWLSTETSSWLTSRPGLPFLPADVSSTTRQSRCSVAVVRHVWTAADMVVTQGSVVDFRAL